MAELVDAPDSKSGFFGSVSSILTNRTSAGVAQLAERLPCNQDVAGSIPVSGTIFCLA